MSEENNALCMHFLLLIIDQGFSKKFINYIFILIFIYILYVICHNKMGAGESKPAEAVEEVEEVKIADPAPMDKDEVLHTLEKVVSHEYGKIQDELAASATQHAASVKIKVCA